MYQTKEFVERRHKGNIPKLVVFLDRDRGEM